MGSLPPNAVLLSPLKKIPVRRVCVVGSCNDQDVVDLLRTHYNVDVFQSETGKEFVDKEDIVFMIDDFTSAAFYNLTRADGERLRIMSPVFVRNKMYKGVEELVSPRMNRPAYCDLLKDVNIAVDQVERKPELVNYAHYMGASVRKEMGERTNYLITTVARGSNYRLAVSLGRMVLRPAWIHLCWENRNNSSFDPIDSHLLAEYKLRAFDGLKIAFCDFSEAELADMKKNVIANCGQLVLDMNEATHVVFKGESADGNRPEPVQGQRHVKEQWLWESIQMDAAANEDVFAIRTERPAKKSSRIFSPYNGKTSKSSMGMLDTSNTSVLSNGDGMYSTDDIEVLTSSPRRVDKRQMVAREILDTETNYLKALSLLIKFKEMLEENMGKFGDTPGRTDQTPPDIQVNLIFGKIPPILLVHENICEKLRAALSNWKSDVSIGKIWLEAEQDLLRVYPSYINAFDTMKDALEKADKNTKFHAFLKARESNAEFKKHTVKELLIRPVQRLPSVLLLLRELLKKTESRSNDGKLLQQALQAIDRVLNRANDARRINDDYALKFHLCSEIDHLPPGLFSSSRELKGDITVYCLGGTGFWKNQAKKTIRIMLFHDVLELAKVRELAPMRTGTLSRMSRQFSVVNMRAEKKKYKHIEQVTLNKIRELHYIEVVQDDMYVFMLIIRGETEGDEEWIVHPEGTNEKANREFLDMIGDQVYFDTGREVEIIYEQISKVSASTQDMIMRAIIKRGQLNNSSANLNSTLALNQTILGERTLPHQTSFRRALSNASLTITNKFKLQSRTNLRSIYEHDQPDQSFGDASMYERSVLASTPASSRQSLRSLFKPFNRSMIFRRDSQHDKENTSHFSEV